MTLTAIATTIPSSHEIERIDKNDEVNLTQTNEPTSGVTNCTSSHVDAETTPIHTIEQALKMGKREQAIASCVRTMSTAIGRLCFVLLGSQAEAEEATQETFLTAFDHANSYRGEGEVRAWLFGIARRICAKRLDVRIRQNRRTHMLSHEEPYVDSVESSVALEQQKDQVRVALEALRPTEREAILLRFETGLSFREVAVASGIDEATARKRVERALQKLRKLIEI